MAFLIIKAASAVNVLSEYHKLWHVSCVCAHVSYLLNYVGGGGGGGSMLFFISTLYMQYSIWALWGQNLPSGFPSKLDSNQSPQLQRLARISKFRL